MILSGVRNRDGPNGIEIAIRTQEEIPGTKILQFSGIAQLLDDLLVDARRKGHDLDLMANPVLPIFSPSNAGLGSLGK
jgi:hypothetical protein